jgi:isopenicillin N synthase-like dioxygenase
VAGGEASRQSTAFFYDPRLETVIEPVRQLIVEGDEAHYEPYTVAEPAANRVEDYLNTFGRPGQIEAWRTGTPYVAEVLGPS